MLFTGIDLAAIFGLSMPASECVLRGSAVYGFLFAVFRLLIRREFISEDALWVQRRLEGIGYLDQLKSVDIESDRTFSVIRKNN